MTALRLPQNNIPPCRLESDDTALHRPPSLLVSARKEAACTPPVIHLKLVGLPLRSRANTPEIFLPARIRKVPGGAFFLPVSAIPCPGHFTLDHICPSSRTPVRSVHTSTDSVLSLPGMPVRPADSRHGPAAAPFSRRSLALLDSRSMFKTTMLSGSVARSALQRHMAAKGHQEQCFPSRGAKDDERAI